MKFLICVFISLVVCPLVSAQQWYKQGSLNIANMVEGYNYDGNSSSDLMYPRIGASAGAIVDYPFNDKIALESGALLTLRGASGNMMIIGGSFSSNVGLVYVDVPLNLKFSTDKVNERSLFALLGPYGSVGIFGVQTLKHQGRTDRELVQWGNDSNRDEYHRLDGGFRIGLGHESPKTRIQISYNIGLANVHSYPDSHHFEKHRFFEISLLRPF